MSVEAVTADLTAMIDAHGGPIPVSAFVEQALYGRHGFYVSGGQAGRRGDFLTAPEVGPLFGAVIARAVDTWWREMGSPVPFTVLEGGAGPGTLARAVIAADPDVLSSGALRWVMAERSAEQRTLHPVHEQFASVLPVEEPMRIEHGVVLANELLDNLAFDVFERAGDGWAEIRIAHDGAGFVERRMPVATIRDLPTDGIPLGARLPRQRAARDWVRERRRRVQHGRVVVFDYGATTTELVARNGGWLRTHRGHEGGADWLTDPGSCDITVDVDLDFIQVDNPADVHLPQAEWLRRHGIEELVEEGRAVWEASAGVGDLAALKARSRVREADALLDPDGMGGFHVLEWIVDPDHG